MSDHRPYTYLTATVQEGITRLGVSFRTADLSVMALTIGGVRPHLSFGGSEGQLSISTAGGGPVTAADLALAREIADATSTAVTACPGWSRSVRWGHPGLSRTQTPPSSSRPEPSRAPGCGADRDDTRRDPRRQRQQRRGLHTLQLDADYRKSPAPFQTSWPTEFERCSHPHALARGRGRGDSAASDRPCPALGSATGNV